ncbi:MAG: helix-turn-helix domain-containing protein [Hydrogenobaculum sp.]
MDYEKLGKFIKKKRKEKGWTQEEFANITGLSRQTLSKIESGVVARITIIHMETILRHLGYDICIVPHNIFEKEEPFMCKEDLEWEEY